jgi:hypothetical protein
MFCGWRLINSKPELVKLGSGTLSIDALTGNCYFNRQPIEQLSIAVELREWLKDELTTNRIPLESISRAHVKAELSLSEIPWSSRTINEQFFDHGKHVKTDRMHRCIIECESEVTTDETRYQSSYRDIEEWPVGWPAV